MENSKLVNVIIPIYKDYITYEEKISLRQCIKILSGYPITLVCKNGLNLSVYYNEFAYFKVEYFDSSFFENIQGYNKLMLSNNFYSRFKKYKFILIYQLDAFVFRDELKYWCSQKYDYIGAPWIGNTGSFEKVGNGGFSLRRTKIFSMILSYPGPVYKPNKILNEIKFRVTKNILKSYIYYLAKCLGYRNSISYLIKENKINEDAFWTATFKYSWIKLKISPVEMALKFSFEKNPELLFKLNNQQLPFGCHAWMKNNYEEFWKQYIK